MISLLGLVQQGKEQVFNQTRAALHNLWESAKHTANFIGKFVESVVCLGVNIVCYAIGNISGTEFLLQTTTSIVNIMSQERNVSSKPLIAAGAGAAIGGIIGTFLVPVPGVGTVL